MTQQPIRAASPQDVPALHALIERAYRGDSAKTGWTHEADLLDGQRTDAAMLSEMLADPLQHLLIAPGDAGPIGCVCVKRLDSGAGYLGLLTVDPKLQAAGLGRRLIAAAEDVARAWGATIMEMTVIAQRRELIDWYIRRGYTPTGERRPFPHGDERFGRARRDDLEFVVLNRSL